MVPRINARRAFTLVELLTVIGIMMLVAAMALPNFIEMMKGQRWTASIAGIQGMLLRARSMATSSRHDFSIEFKIEDNGTTMWLESEINEIERIPDLWALQHEIGGLQGLRYFMAEIFKPSGGTYQETWYECKCANCGNQWTQINGTIKCPSCSNTGAWNSPAPIISRSYFYNIGYNPANTSTGSYGDNARQSDCAVLGQKLTIDRARSQHFLSWDSQSSVEAYGYDEYPDLRVGTNGALVQAQEPVICIREIGRENRRLITVVRCTGRVIGLPSP